MTGNPVYDVAIIGGGIIGTASAMALSRRPGVSVVVIEAENKLAAHQTGNNSGVIHSGLYYKPGSLKAQNCTLGRKALYRFCEEHHIAHERSGKVVVATREEDLPVLKELHRRGKANGLDGVREIGHEELKELEPNVTGLAGLHVPETGIVDYTAVTQTYATLVKITEEKYTWVPPSLASVRKPEISYSKQPPGKSGPRTSSTAAVFNATE